MKKLLLLLSASVAALLAGAAVFLWTGHDPSELKLEELGNDIREIVLPAQPTSPTLSPTPTNNPEEPTPTEPGIQPPATEPTPPTNPEPPTPSIAPPDPPVEEYSEDDKEKLEDLLGQ